MKEKKVETVRKNRRRNIGKKAEEPLRDGTLYALLPNIPMNANS